MLQLTDGGLGEASSAFYDNPVNSQSFTTDFTFLQKESPQNDLTADGFTFAIQNAELHALGPNGSSVGYAGIGKSVAIDFNIYELDNALELRLDGAPAAGNEYFSLDGSGINLTSGNRFTAHVNYNGTNLTLTLTDTLSLATWSHPFPINIPATVGGDTAYVGFTGGTGGLPSIQQTLTWTLTNP